MYKVIWFLKRQEGVTPAQFREHYERSHSALGKKYFGHLMSGYRRNYVTGTFGRAQLPDGDAGAFGPLAWGFDCIVEWLMPDQAAFDAIMDILRQPDVWPVFHEDESHFLDGKATMMITCDECDTGIG